LQRELDKEKRLSAGLVLSMETLQVELDNERSESDRLENTIENLEYDLMLDRATIAELKAMLPPSPSSKHIAAVTSEENPVVNIHREYVVLQLLIYPDLY
jgi:hypothetical protein